MGNMLTLSVTADGPGKNGFTYQWKRRDGTSLPNTASKETTPNLKIRSVTPSDSGSYYCVVMNQWGNTIESNDAAVIVLCKLLFIFKKCQYMKNRAKQAIVNSTLYISNNLNL